MEITIKYPHIKVQLTGKDGNAFAVMAEICRELKDNGISREEIDQFINEATSGDYNNLLRTCMSWVDVS